MELAQEVEDVRVIPPRTIVLEIALTFSDRAVELAKKDPNHEEFLVEDLTFKAEDEIRSRIRALLKEY